MKEKHLLSTNLPVAYLIKLHCYTDKDSLSNIMAHSHIAGKWKSPNLKTDLIFLPRCTQARQAVKGKKEDWYKESPKTELFLMKTFLKHTLIYEPKDEAQW